MAGVTDAAFRARLRRNGCRWLFTEMVSAAAVARGNRKTLGYLRDVPDLGPDLAVQLFGSNPDELAEAALCAQAAGFSHVNLNMGCPVRKVIRSGAGSALLADPTRARQCVEALRAAVDGVLSVKFRAGWDASRINCVDMARMAEERGADLLILHPRTRAQGFSGRADWSLVGPVVAAVSVPVLGNGDVETGAEAVERRRACGCAGVMIGRGALANPAIFRDAERCDAGATAVAASEAEVGSDLLQQLDDLAVLKGARVALTEMRKFAAWGARGMRGGAEFRRRVQVCTALEEFRDEVRAFFVVDGRRGSGGLEEGDAQ